MQPILVFVAIAFILLAFGGLEPTKSPIPEDVSEKEKLINKANLAKVWPQKTNGISQNQGSQEPGVLVETYITSGPENGEIINDASKITFEFKGKVFPEGISGRFYYETKLEGVDNDWKKTSSEKRTINLPAGSKEYIFWVRAKINNFIDLTPEKRTFKVEISPYFGKIMISSASHSYIKLSNKSSEDEKINITGWQITGDKGTITVSKGVELFVPGEDMVEKDIFIEKGDNVYFYSEKNPFGRKEDFRPNKCFGYLTSYYDSVSSFNYSKICPKIEDRDICHLSDDCQKYIRKLRSCKMPDYSEDFSVLLDSKCKEFIDNYTSEYLNYEGCINNYFKDDDFYKNAWYIYVGYDIVGRCTEKIYLYDESGLFVDDYECRI